MGEWPRPAQAADCGTPAGPASRAAWSGGDRQHDGVGGDRRSRHAVAFRAPVPRRGSGRPGSRRLPAARCPPPWRPSRTCAPSRPSSAAVASACSRPSGTVAMPMSAASRAPSSAVLITVAARPDARVVAGDVQRGDDEQVPQPPPGPLALAPRGQPVAQPLPVQVRRWPDRRTGRRARRGRPWPARRATASGTWPAPRPDAAGSAASRGAAWPARLATAR